MAGRIAGTVFVSVDGVSYALAGDFTWRVASVQRETMIGADGIHGFSERPIAGFISGNFRDVGSYAVADFADMVNVSVVAELANGKTIIGRNMWTTEASEVKSDDATFSVRWESEQVEEA